MLVYQEEVSVCVFSWTEKDIYPEAGTFRLKMTLYHL